MSKRRSPEDDLPQEPEYDQLQESIFLVQRIRGKLTEQLTHLQSLLERAHQGDPLAEAELEVHEAETTYSANLANVEGFLSERVQMLRALDQPINREGLIDEAKSVHRSIFNRDPDNYELSRFQEVINDAIKGYYDP